MSIKYGSDKVDIIKGDITKEAADAIVNAANSSLMGGGGVDGAIHSAGGSSIIEECRKIIKEIGKLNTGEAVITSGGKLKAKYVIHTVGPVWRGGNDNEEALLSNCYINCLKLAAKNDIRTIAFPNISTGVFGYPKDMAARTAYYTVKAALEKYHNISQVRFVCFDNYNYELYNRLKSEDSREKINLILDFIPYFELEKNNYFSFEQPERCEEDDFPIDHPDYDKGITDFIDSVYETDLLKEDYSDYLKKIGIQDFKAEAIINVITKADMLLLRSILTYFVRQERFNDGLWEKAARERIFLNILYRLKELNM